MINYVQRRYIYNEQLEMWNFKQNQLQVNAVFFCEIVYLDTIKNNRKSIPEVLSSFAISQSVH